MIKRRSERRSGELSDADWLEARLHLPSPALENRNSTPLGALRVWNDDEFALVADSRCIPTRTWRSSLRPPRRDHT